MKVLYLDCGMGAAGDMLMAALSEISPDRGAFFAKMNSLGLRGVRVEAESATRCGIVGTHVRVTVGGDEETSDDAHEHEHDHERMIVHNHRPERMYVRDDRHESEHGHHHDHEHHHGHAHVHAHHHEHEHHHGHTHVHEHDHEDHHEHEHSHVSMDRIERIIGGLDVPEAVRRDAIAVYRLIAEAESRAHGVPVDKIHFHEVGDLDAIADIVGVSLLMHELEPDRVVASAVRVGRGHVRCAHGVLPVPAPATEHILHGVPIFSGSIDGEMCTPTGAALLKHFVDEFGEMPQMAVESSGYGMGTKEFEAANCVRAMIGVAEDKRDSVCELTFNVDDMTAEEIGFALERFFDDGALEAYSVPVTMKRSRPGALISVMCREEDREAITESIFRNTTTIGLRESSTTRRVLDRKVETIATPVGEVRVKRSTGYGTTRQKYEFVDLAKIAREQKISLFEARAIAHKAEHSKE